jgi:hypothetical protein
MESFCPLFEAAKQGCSSSLLTGLPVVGRTDSSDYELLQTQIERTDSYSLLGVALK